MPTSNRYPSTCGKCMKKTGAVDGKIGARTRVTRKIFQISTITPSVFFSHSQMVIHQNFALTTMFALFISDGNDEFQWREPRSAFDCNKGMITFIAYPPSPLPITCPPPYHNYSSEVDENNGKITCFDTADTYFQYVSMTTSQRLSVDKIKKC